MARQARSDATLKTIAKKLGISEDNFRHENGRKMRNDKTLGAIRKEEAKKKK